VLQSIVVTYMAYFVTYRQQTLEVAIMARSYHIMQLKMGDNDQNIFLSSGCCV
jgi:hypothetical protein